MKGGIVLGILNCKVKKHWVTIAVTGLTLGLSFAGLNCASAELPPVNEATVEAIIKEGAVTSGSATNEATAKPTENTPATAESRSCHSVRSTGN